VRFDLVEGQRKPRCGFGPLAQYILLKAFESLTDWNVTQSKGGIYEEIYKKVYFE